MMPSVVLLVWFTLCAEQAIRLRHIANELTLGAAGVALLYLFSSGHTWLGAGVAEAGWALVVCMLLTAPGYHSGRLGPAEVKLLGALALATDRWHLMGTFIGAVLCMALWACFGGWAWAFFNKRWRALLAGLNPHLEDPLPFVPFLLMGFAATLIWLD